VLPFSNPAGDPGREYLVQGTHDRLVAELRRAGLAVVARSSVLRYANRAVPEAAIARELDADVLLDGGVRPSGDRLTIRVRILDPADGSPAWDRTFSGRLGDVDALQARVVRAVAGEVGTPIPPEARARLDDAPAVDPEAYDAYLRGLFRARLFTLADLDAALGDFDRALAADPSFAPAWVGIARVRLLHPGARAPAGVEARADAAAGRAATPAARREVALERALALEPDLAEAHRVLADARAWTDWRLQAADTAYRRALALDPGEAETRIQYAHLLAILGRGPAARELARSAVRLDPVNPFTRGLYGTVLYLTGDYATSIEALEPILDAYPTAAFVRPPLAGAYERLGRTAAALRVREEGARLAGDTAVAAALEDGYRAGGYGEAARHAADLLAARAGEAGARVSPLRVARLYASAGREDRALTWLARAVQVREAGAVELGVLPALGGLHGSRAFAGLARRARVPVVTLP